MDKGANRARTEVHKPTEARRRRLVEIKVSKEIADVFVDIISPFLVEEVPCPFNNNHLLQKRHISLQPAFVNVILGARCIICQVKITHNKLHWNFDLSTSPRSSELPVSTNSREAIK